MDFYSKFRGGENHKFAWKVAIVLLDFAAFAKASVVLLAGGHNRSRFGGCVGFFGWEDKKKDWQKEAKTGCAL